MTTGEPLLQVTDLAVARGGLRLLEGISFDLAPGGALVLTGPNGVGKSSLLRVLAGLSPAAAGMVRLAPDAVAYAGHAEAVKPTLTVDENLGFWAAVEGSAADLAAARAALGLQDFGSRPAHMLSAGQRRRLSLSRLVLTGRPVWLMDEPAAALDAASLGLLEALLALHLGAGGAAVIATHQALALRGAVVLDLSQHRAGRASPGAFAAAFA